MTQPSTPFTFGVLLSSSPDPRSLATTVARAEQLGFSAAYLSDHLGHRLGPITALAVACGATERLRIGTLVLNCVMRNPVVLAQELVTIDLFSQGRLDVGLGAGWLLEDFSQAGIPMESPGRRLRRLIEYIDVLERFWAGEPFSFRGEFYRLDNVSPTPRPAQPRLRLIVGASGPRALRLAAEHADMISIDAPHPSGRADPAELLSGSTREAYLDRAERALAAARAAGRSVRLQMQVPSGLVCLDPTPDHLRSIAERWRLPIHSLARLGPALIGDLGEVAERLVEWRRVTGISEVVVQWPDMESLAPLVTRLTGR